MKRNQLYIILSFVIFLSCSKENSQLIIDSTIDSNYISFRGEEAQIEITSLDNAGIYISEKDFSGVHKVAQWFSSDIAKVSGKKLNLLQDAKGEQLIIVGTLGKNAIIDSLVSIGKLDVSNIENKWEASLLQVVKNPVSGVGKALFIVGSDKRGTMYGMLDISRKIGVSPWYWWGDVPVQKHSNIYITKAKLVFSSPKVKYRGIFINDEEPCLGRWAVEKYGGFNHEMYVNVFELILRQKGNFLWPAMWWASFYEDDPKNAELANELGIVVSTSHHEPMMRPHADWKKQSLGKWNYQTNKKELDKFWAEGIRRMGDKESIVTLAMRGDGDEAMEENANVSLLEEIVANQRRIIEEVTNKPLNATPQVWALYKEVQEYYDKGMRVPDDVTLLLCDDNWGNVRYLPAIESKPRSGGYGMYYHFDYVGAPRSYKWANVRQISKIWEQLYLTYTHGVDRIWVVNVGDIKPMELPISFFFDYAWNPDAITVHNVNNYTLNWAKSQFGNQHANEIAEILNLYTKYNARVTPELLNSNTFSLTNYREFETVAKDYELLAQKAEELRMKIGAEQDDAFFQLVYYPVKSMETLYKMYLAQAYNHKFYKQNRQSANFYANEVKRFFEIDSLLTHEYHNMNGGKWNHMMAQTHIGYTSWNHPEINILPQVFHHKNTSYEIGVAINNEEYSSADTLVFNNLKNDYYQIDIYNLPENTNATIESSSKHFEIITTNPKCPFGEASYIIHLPNHALAELKGNIETEVSILIAGKEIIKIPISIQHLEKKNLKGFIETNRAISIEATNYSYANAENINWHKFIGHGKNEGAMLALPYGVSLSEFANDYLAYNFTLQDNTCDAEIELTFTFSPVLNYKNTKGLVFGVSVDDGSITELNLHEGCEGFDWNYAQWWLTAVNKAEMKKTLSLKVKAGEHHTLKYWFKESGLVLQKIEINNGGLKESYLGAPQSIYY